MGKEESTKALCLRININFWVKSNSRTRRRHEGALPLVGESDLKPVSELKP